MFIDSVIELHRRDPKQHGIPEHARRNHAKLLTSLLDRLAELLNCPIEQLRLDHDPALENRTKRKAHRWIKGTGYREIIEYDPPANDPDFLCYRPHGAEYEGSHDIKTRIRGDRGQFADNVLAKRERRRLKKLEACAKKTKPHPSLRKIAKRPIQNANRWPPKGSRKLMSRRKPK